MTMAVGTATGRVVLKLGVVDNDLGRTACC